MQVGDSDMRIAVCGARTVQREQLCRWIVEYAALQGLTVTVARLDTPEQLSLQASGSFQIAYIAYGGIAGFRAARMLRERDKCCRIILIDDTQQYAIAGLRLHFTDFILCPISFEQVVRSMRLALG